MNKQATEDQEERNLYEVFVRLENQAEAQAFLKDLCTPQERSILAERWRVCALLAQGDLSYREIHKRTGSSLATISRVARFLKNEPYGGYRLMLQKTASSLT